MGVVDVLFESCSQICFSVKKLNYLLARETTLKLFSLNCSAVYLLLLGQQTPNYVFFFHFFQVKLFH